MDRRTGPEQEFFLLENSGRPSERADEEESSGPACFAPEFVLGLVEVNTLPVNTLYDLEREYAQNLRLALRTARSLGLRFYPLGTYPLPLEPAVRDGLDYRVQVGTVGPERLMDAGRGARARTCIWRCRRGRSIKERASPPPHPPHGKKS